MLALLVMVGATVSPCLTIADHAPPFMLARKYVCVGEVMPDSPAIDKVPLAIAAASSVDRSSMITVPKLTDALD